MGNPARTAKAAAWIAFLLAGAAGASAPATDADQLHSAVNAYTEAYKHLDPFASAPYFGIDGELSKFGDFPSPAYFAKLKKLYQDALAGIKDVRPETLSPKDRRTYELFKEDLDVSLAGTRFPDELLGFNPMGNRLMDYIDQTNPDLTHFPFDSVKHYQDFLQRSRELPAYVDRQIELLRRGLKEGITLSREIAGQVPATYQEGLESDVEKNPFWRPILKMPDTISAADKARISAEFRAMINERILPAYRKFDRFFRTEYLPRCRKGFGLASLPKGREWYAQQIHRQTNTTLAPEEIHATGLKEVRRISREIDQIRKQLGFKGTFEQFLRTLSSDPRYFYSSPAEMFQGFEQVRQKVTPKIPKYFSLVPKTDFKLVQSANPRMSSSSYNEPTDPQPFGRFVVSSNNLHSVPIWKTTTLFLHEAIPGHHFQLARQFELKDQLTEYERTLYQSNAFAEGWALYTEHLGNEMGMYEDPMQRLGNLISDLYRAVRLVVDTGIHHSGWSPGKAARFMGHYLPFTAQTIGDEVNRYAVMPGQALGYKIGQLKILELRRDAEIALGRRFDLKEFHRVVIGNGTMSLGMLEHQVKDWVAAQRGGPVPCVEVVTGAVTKP